MIIYMFNFIFFIFSLLKKLSKKVQDSLAKANEVAEETCSSMRTVRSFANENTEAQRYADKLAITYKLQIKEAIAYAGYMCSNEVRGPHRVYYPAELDHCLNMVDHVQTMVETW